MAKDGENRKQVFEPIIPDIHDWPIQKLSNESQQFLQKVVDKTVSEVIEKAQRNENLDDIIADTLYQERMRIRQNPWMVDPADEDLFWDSINERLLVESVKSINKQGVSNAEVDILRDIVTRYANEISGRFDSRTYKFSRKLLPHGFARLLNASVRRNPKGILAPKKSIHERIQITGHLEQIREMAKIGTIVMVPTHSSNMDSLLMGWAIQAIGLPHFIYGAGLNLFNVKLLAFFMNRLGAYKVDRRKKNLIYNSTLKNYSTFALKKGAHSLFFPGGTRSRSGHIEKKLKLGLLSTAIEAQRLNFINGNGHPKKVFIVPVVISYHFVLEAPNLINDHLEQTGREKYYIEEEEYSTSYKISKLALKFFTASSEIALSFGKPMDIFGNFVDENGKSVDARGNIVDIQKYFMRNGTMKEDEQRDSEYTRMLSEVIIEQYHSINMVFSSHLIAFVAFEIIKKQFKKLDIYELLRLPEEELEIPYDLFAKKAEVVIAILREMMNKGKIDMAPHFDRPFSEVMEHGLKHLGSYHVLRPLKQNKRGNIITEDLKTLYFYHNRLEGYGLEENI